MRRTIIALTMLALLLPSAQLARSAWEPPCISVPADRIQSHYEMTYHHEALPHWTLWASQVVSHTTILTDTGFITQTIGPLRSAPLDAANSEMTLSPLPYFLIVCTPAARPSVVRLPEVR